MKDRETKEQIIDRMCEIMPFPLPEYIRPYVLEAMEIYKQPQPSEHPSSEEVGDNKLTKALMKGFNDLMALKDEHGSGKVTDQVSISLHYETVRQILSHPQQNKLTPEERKGYHDVEEFYRDEQKICSGCDQEHDTVDRNMFDGMCADCTDKALHNDEFRLKAQKQNNKLASGLTP